MKKLTTKTLRVLFLASIILSVSIPVFADESAPATPSGIMLQSISSKSSSFEIIFLIQLAIFLVIISLLLNGSVQKYMSFRWGNTK